MDQSESSMSHYQLEDDDFAARSMAELKKPSERLSELIYEAGLDHYLVNQILTG